VDKVVDGYCRQVDGGRTLSGDLNSKPDDRRQSVAEKSSKHNNKGNKDAKHE